MRQTTKWSYPGAAINHLADDLVIKVVNVHPLDSLAGILLLLPLQNQLNEELLEFLVAVVDAELFKAEWKRWGLFNGSNNMNTVSSENDHHW